MGDIDRNNVKNNVVLLWSQDSVVVTSNYVMGWTVQGLTLGRGKRSFASPNLLDGVWERPSLLFNGCRCLWPRVMPPGPEVDHSYLEQTLRMRENTTLFYTPPLPHLREVRERDNINSFRRRLVEEFQCRSL